MNKPELNFYLSNGEHAVNCLQELSRTATGRMKCNEYFNHAISVKQLMNALEGLNKAFDELSECNKKLQQENLQLRAGDFKTQLDEEIQKVKDQLITLIKEYPENYY